MSTSIQTKYKKQKSLPSHRDSHPNVNEGPSSTNSKLGHYEAQWSRPKEVDKTSTMLMRRAPQKKKEEVCSLNFEEWG